MTTKQYFFCVSETQNYTDVDAYVSDLALSSIWGDDEDAEIPAERITALREIYDAAHRTIKDVADALGTSVRQLAMRYAIPRRTAENWSAGKNEPPLWALLLLQEAVGLLDVLH